MGISKHLHAFPKVLAGKNFIYVENTCFILAIHNHTVMLQRKKMVEAKALAIFQPGLCHRVVSLDKKLCTTLSLSTQVYKWVKGT